MRSARWPGFDRARADAADRYARPVEIIAFMFSLFTLYGCGATPVLYGLVMLISGMPVYVWQQRRGAAVSDRSSLHV